MKTSIPFRISPLPLEPFRLLFEKSDSELSELGALRRIADSRPGFPCRVSLVDASPGERVILIAHPHHCVSGPYQGTGPIYVRENAREAVLDVKEVPEVVRVRLMSVRAYDSEGLLVGSEVTEGRDIESPIETFLANQRVAYIHLHNARPGCYSCRVDRARPQVSEETSRT